MHRTFRSSVLSALAVVLIASMLGPCAASAQTSNPAEAQVRDLVARYANAREGEDPVAIRRLFLDDADQLVSSGEWRRGQEALVSGMLSSSRNNPGSRTITVQHVRFLNGDVAIADARYEIAAYDGRPARRMWSTFVAMRTPDGWKIASIRNMLPAR